MLYTHDISSQTLSAFALLDLGRPGWRDFNIAALGRAYDGKVLIHDGTNNDFYLVDLQSGYGNDMSIINWRFLLTILTEIHTLHRSSQQVSVASSFSNLVGLKYV